MKEQCEAAAPMRRGASASGTWCRTSARRPCFARRPLGRPTQSPRAAPGLPWMRRRCQRRRRRRSGGVAFAGTD
eukprot:8369373-Pyramimonas_sp.AAC.1